MISPLDIATGGYLCNTESVAADGYLCYKAIGPISPGVIIQDKLVGGGGKRKFNAPYLVAQRKREDEEILIIIKTFLRCQ